MLMKNLKLPVFFTPRRNCTLTELPSNSGLVEMKPTFTEVFHPPPFGCAGGTSTVVPCTVTVPPLVETVASPEFLTRRSACPATGGDVNVVISTMRKRNFVISNPLLLVNVRRMESVPKSELFAGSLVRSRARFGGDEEETAGSSSAAANSELPKKGE